MCSVDRIRPRLSSYYQVLELCALLDIIYPSPYWWKHDDMFIQRRTLPQGCVRPQEKEEAKQRRRRPSKGSIIGTVTVLSLPLEKEKKDDVCVSAVMVRCRLSGPLAHFPELYTDRACLAALSSRQTSHPYLSRFLPNLFLSPLPSLHESVINHFWILAPFAQKVS